MNNLIKAIAKLFRTMRSSQQGFTAIQTAVVAVASLAVAGTLGTSLVSAGLDAADETEQMIHTAIQNIQGTFDIRGSVLGKSTTTGSSGTIGQLTFSVALVLSDGSIDFTPPNPSPENNGLAGPDSKNVITISYTDDYQHVDNLYWTIEKLGKDDGDYILNGKEMYQITIGGNKTPSKNGGNLIDALDPLLSTSTKFSLDVKSPQGANMVLERTTPSYIQNIVNFR
jgi:flagellin FlaB